MKKRLKNKANGLLAHNRYAQIFLDDAKALQEMAQIVRQGFENAKANEREYGSKEGQIRFSKNMGKGKSFGVFSQKTIDDYTERKYNNYSYKEYSYNDKIVFITGSNQHPIIDRIVKVNGENEAVIGFCLQEVIENAGQHDSLDYLGEVAGKRILEQHTSADFKTYGTLKKERERYNREGASYFNEDGKRGESPQEYIGFVKNKNELESLTKVNILDRVQKYNKLIDITVPQTNLKRNPSQQNNSE